ncbi:hypothetical protein [Psychrobacillus sp. NPDC096389]|uniref:hypothetical protein n=1 Tax=Psychrobacillus sp. NPDC096389 TaxID=3364490 RepID=UPI0037FF4EB1
MVCLFTLKKGVDVFDIMVSTLTAIKYGFGRMDPVHKESLVSEELYEVCLFTPDLYFPDVPLL